MGQTLTASMRKARAVRDAEKPRGGVGVLLRFPRFQNLLAIYSCELPCFAQARVPPVLFGEPSRGPVRGSMRVFVPTRRKSDNEADGIDNNAIQFSWDAAYPLFAFTSVELGGLELSVSWLLACDCYVRVNEVRVR
jgi:hypothetical protein